MDGAGCLRTDWRQAISKEFYLNGAGYTGITLSAAKSIQGGKGAVRLKADVALTGDGDAIWRRVSDLGAIPKYWPAIRSVEVVRSDESESIARIEFAFGGKSEAKVTVDHADRTLLIFYASGALTGTQRATISDDRLLVELDLTFHGTHRLLSPLEGDRFASETRQALERLVAPES